MVDAAQRCLCPITHRSWGTIDIMHRSDAVPRYNSAPPSDRLPINQTSAPDPWEPPLPLRRRGVAKGAAIWEAVCHVAENRVRRAWPSLADRGVQGGGVNVDRVNLASRAAVLIVVIGSLSALSTASSAATRASATVRGVVLLGAAKAEGVEVSLVSSTHKVVATAVTGVTGAYSVSAPVGTYDLRLVSSDQIATGSVNLSRDRSLNVTLDTQDNVNVTVRTSAGGPVADASVAAASTGTVLLKNTGGLTIKSSMSGHPGCVTSTSGSCHVGLLEGEPSKISASWDGSTPGVTSVRPESLVATATVTLPDPITVSGIVESALGVPTGGATAELAFGSITLGESTTTSNGKYSLTVEPGSYRLSFGDAGQVMSGMVDLHSSETENVQFQALAPMTVEAVDVDGKPVANANVSVSNLVPSSGVASYGTGFQELLATGVPTSCTTNLAGECSVQSVVGGVVDAVVTTQSGLAVDVRGYPGSSPVVAQIPGPAQPVPYEGVIQSGGQVDSADFQQISLADFGTGLPVSSGPIANGLFFASAPPGKYQVTMWGPSGQINGTINLQGPTDTVVTVPLREPLVVETSDQSGDPVPGVQVNQSTFTPESITEPFGAFTVTSSTPGCYTNAEGQCFVDGFVGDQIPMGLSAPDGQDESVSPTIPPGGGTVDVQFATPVVLSGTLIDSNGDPVSDATISALSQSDSAYVATSGSGSFSLALLPGSYNMVVTGDGQRLYGSATITSSTAVTIQLAPNEPVSIDVTDSLNSPIANTSVVTFTDDSKPVSWSTPFGSWDVLGLESGCTTAGSGACSITAPLGTELNGNATIMTAHLAGSVLIAAGSNSLNLQMTVPDEPITISGQVLLDGNPVAGATVLSYGAPSTTDASGDYSVTTLPGAINLQVQAGTFYLAVDGTTSTSETEDILLPTTAEATTTALDSSGAPIPGARVSFANDNALSLVEPNGWTANGYQKGPACTTNGNGRCSVSAWIGGTGQVYATSPSGAQGISSDTIEAGSNDFTVQCPTATTKATVLGEVATAAGAPVLDADVLLYSGSTLVVSALTNGSGEYSMSALPGNYTTEVVTPTQQLTGSVSFQDPIVDNFQLAPTATVVVHVESSGGGPVPGVAVASTLLEPGPGGNSSTSSTVATSYAPQLFCTTDASGACALTLTQGSAATIWALASDGEVRSSTIEAPGATTSVTLKLLAAG